GNYKGVMIIRIEELYPFPSSSLKKFFADLPETTPFTWVQDEPSNMGAWPYIRARFGDKFLKKFSIERVSRPRSASPATGSNKAHRPEQELLLEAAFSTVPSEDAQPEEKPLAAAAR